MASKDTLPEFNAVEILQNIDKACELVDNDDTIDFLIVNAVKKLWSYFMANDCVENTLNSFKGGKYSEIVKDTFTKEYNNVTNLNIPEGYAFTKGDGKIIQPNMMQKLVACKIRDEKSLGNWSGVGAGKTLSAIVASRVIKSKLTVIVTLKTTLEGWKNEILSAYPDSYIFDRNNYHEMKDSVNNKFLLLNYEKFQQSDSAVLVRDLVQNYTIDFIVLDEIQSAKQRGSIATLRRELIENMISNTRAINSEVHVLGISATPVINNLNEAVSLLQMIVGDKFEYLTTSPTIYNCLDIHKKLILHGVRYVPKYDIGIERIDIEVNGIHLLDELKVLKRTDILKIERVLINDKLHAVKNELTTGTIIYTHYVSGVVPYIKNFLRSQNLTYVEYTGENKDDLQKFINGEVDILIGSSTIGTGLDGLQKICNKLIILNLPWTHAAYTQLLGRIYRQGSVYNKIKVIIPQIYIEYQGDRWSYDKYRIDKIEFKKTLGDAVLDGVFPEEKISSPSVMFAEAIEALHSWIQRLESEKEKLVQPA